MREIIAKLIKLQEVQDRVFAYGDVVKQMPLDINSLQSQLEQSTSALEAKEEALVVAKVKRQTTDSELTSILHKSSQLKAQQVKAKSNKEYSAMQSEINYIGRRIDQIEEEEIAQLYEIDQLEADMVTRKENVESTKKSFKKEEKEKKSLLRKAQKSLHAANAEHQALTAEIPKRYLSQFTQRLVRNNTRAIVPVKTDSCTGCNMTMPAQHINNVRKNDRLQSCEGCGRILYWFFDYCEVEATE